MINPHKIYDLLLGYGSQETLVEEIIIGLTWTFCKSAGVGLCMSSGSATRTLPWSGTLVNKPVSELATWLLSWDIYQATVGMSVVNSTVNSTSELASTGIALSPDTSANLAVFEHFLPQISNQKVCIIGRYPGLDKYKDQMQMNVLELNPTKNDFPAPACEYLLPEADWVFLTATSIANKTFPRLVELSQNAQLVLMGPTLPWLPELGEMGINYLAGVTIKNLSALRQTVAEGGGVRIFDTGVEYRVVKVGD